MRFLLAFWICCFVLSVSAQGIEPHFRLVDLVSMAKGYNAVFLSGKADIDISGKMKISPARRFYRKHL